MALDEPLAGDEVIEDNGVTFIIDKILLDEAKPINVDFITSPNGSGFKLTSPMTAAGAAGCGGSCSSC
jgi:Fe-S cluster assembly iron-binding protein IscA